MGQCQLFIIEYWRSYFFSNLLFFLITGHGEGKSRIGLSVYKQALPFADLLNLWRAVLLNFSFSQPLQHEAILRNVEEII